MYFVLPTGFRICTCIVRSNLNCAKMKYGATLNAESPCSATQLHSYAYTYTYTYTFRRELDSRIVYILSLQRSIFIVFGVRWQLFFVNLSTRVSRLLQLKTYFSSYRKLIFNKNERHESESSASASSLLYSYVRV